MLAESRIPALICHDLDCLVRELGDDIGFVLVTEEALVGADLRPIAAWIDGQPEWSDLPFVLLTRKGGGLERNPGAGRFLDTLGNVTFLERPFHPTTLISLARAALRARRRQYDARARLKALQDSQERLRTVNETLEARARSAPESTSWRSPSCTRRRSWKRSASSPAASPTTSTTCSPR